jgi:glyoxylase-like metal-dependent hydrolase (beta-lactamase superfamily II)
MGDKTPADVVAMKVSDEETVKIEGIDLKALYTPGHTSESFSFLMKDRIFTGDTLLIKGNPKDSYNSLFGKLLKLPDDTLVYPAHDYKGETVSTILEEKKFNPRLQVNSVDEYVDIMNNLNLPNPKMMDVAVPSNLNLGIDFNRQKVNNGIEPEQFNEIKNDPDAILIDLREQIEIDKEGMIKNSKIVPFPSMYEYLDKNKDKLKDKRILFYCAHGHRSTLAVQISKSYNFTNCCHLIGGLKNWKKEGLDLI